MYKSSCKWLCWVDLDTNIFHSKSRLNYSRLQRNFFGGSKITFFVKWPHLTLLDEFDVEKKVKISGTCWIKLNFGKCLVFKYLSPVRTNSGKYFHFCYLGPIRANESQRALNVQKLPQMTFFWVYLDANKHFHSKSWPNFKESVLGVKNHHFWEMTPGFPTLWVWCRKVVETSKTCKILLYFGKWQICPLFVSRPNTTINDNDMLFYSLTTMMFFLTKVWYGFLAYTVYLFIKAYHRITYKLI